MQVRMIRWQCRRGRETAAISIGLFILSLCVVAVFYRWVVPSADSNTRQADFRFIKPKVEPPVIRNWHHVDGFPTAIAQIESVFWEPDDTSTLRTWLVENNRLEGAEVLEIGCGTGLVAITCALHGAKQVIATDINSAAVLNAAYNADLSGVITRVKVRQVNEAHPGPFEVISADEKFDFIISNPPWEDAPVTSPAAYAFYDPQFGLLDAILSQSQEHLHSGGRLLLTYGCKTAIERVRTTAPLYGWQVKIHDDRHLEELPEVFLPGMLLELNVE